ncbi:hypothetical protein HAX54_001160 [Datura stramonium]|uniref:Uncharacterized protein n=1 Tax=Datura stramonium TaxID=4076 RepID=A0ABS8T1X2_DATST|nr:hypothetical protein [Datura stramonium]
MIFPSSPLLGFEEEQSDEAGKVVVTPGLQLDGSMCFPPLSPTYDVLVTVLGSSPFVSWNPVQHIRCKQLSPHDSRSSFVVWCYADTAFAAAKLAKDNDYINTTPLVSL